MYLLDHDPAQVCARACRADRFEDAALGLPGQHGVRVGPVPECGREGVLEPAQLVGRARLGCARDQHGAPPGGAGEPFRQPRAGQLVREHERRARRLARERLRDTDGRAQVAPGVDHRVRPSAVVDEPHARVVRVGLPERADERVGHLPRLGLDRHALAASGAPRGREQHARLRDVVAHHARERLVAGWVPVRGLARRDRLREPRVAGTGADQQDARGVEQRQRRHRRVRPQRADDADHLRVANHVLGRARGDDRGSVGAGRPLVDRDEVDPQLADAAPDLLDRELLRVDHVAPDPGGRVGQRRVERQVVADDAATGDDRAALGPAPRQYGEGGERGEPPHQRRCFFWYDLTTRYDGRARPFESISAESHVAPFRGDGMKW